MELLLELLGNIAFFADELFDGVANKGKSKGKFLLTILVYLVVLSFFLVFLYLSIATLIYCHQTSSLILFSVGLLLVLICMYFGYKLYKFTLGLWFMLISLKSKKKN